MTGSEKFSLYLRASKAALMSTAVTRLSYVIVVWLLNRILAKDDYGDFALSLTIITLLEILASAGLRNSVMYRTSRLRERTGEAVGVEFASAALGWSILVSAIFALGVYLLAPHATALAGKPEIARWLGPLSLLIPLQVSRGVYVAWFQARQRIPESITFSEILPAIGKSFFVMLTWLVWPTPMAIVLALLLSEAIPLAIWSAMAPLNPLQSGWMRHQLTAWDVQYGIKLTLASGLNKVIWTTDILLVGFLTTSEGTAEYSVAAMFALSLLIVHRIMNTVLTPRIGRFLGVGARSEIQREYDQARTVAFLGALFGLLLFAFFGEPLLRLFGDYAGAFPILLVLGAGYLGHVSFGMNGGFLNIAGYPGFTLGTTVLLLVLNVVLNLLLIPRFGPLGAAMATLVSLVAVNALISWIVYLVERLRTYNLMLAATTGLAGLALLSASVGIIRHWVLLVVLLAAFFTATLRARRELARIITRLIPGVLPGA